MRNFSVLVKQLKASGIVCLRHFLIIARRIDINVNEQAFGIFQEILHPTNNVWREKYNREK